MFAVECVSSEGSFPEVFAASSLCSLAIFVQSKNDGCEGLGTRLGVKSTITLKESMVFSHS